MDMRRALARAGFLGALVLRLAAGPLLGCAGAAQECAPTAPNPRGPFHLPDAPFVERLDTADEPGERIEFSGRVLALPDCRPVAGATLDIWHANAGGIYYNLEADDRPEQYRLRGRIRSGPDGGFGVVTVRPGRYGAAAGGRPPHIHVTITAPGLEPLTTQVYFPGDPGNARDGLFRRSLVATLRPRPAAPARLSFDFVLAPAAAGR